MVLPIAKISNPNCQISGICINTKNMEHYSREKLKNKIEELLDYQQLTHLLMEQKK